RRRERGHVLQCTALVVSIGAPPGDVHPRRARDQLTDGLDTRAVAGSLLTQTRRTALGVTHDDPDAKGIVAVLRRVRGSLHAVTQGVACLTFAVGICDRSFVVEHAERDEIRAALGLQPMRLLLLAGPRSG